VKALTLFFFSALFSTLHAAELAEGSFRIRETTVTGSQVLLSFTPEESFYYALYRGESVDSISTVVDLATHPNDQLIDSDKQGLDQAFYRIHKIPIEHSLDLDGDGIKDSAELDYPEALDPLDPRDANLDFDNDGITNKEELNNPSGPSDPSDAIFETIHFRTEDNFNIAASLGNPNTVESRIPAVIFIHQGGSAKQEWRSVAKQAFRQGWATFAYDIRGHGESSGQWKNAWYDDPNNAPLDLVAAIDYLKKLPNIDGDRIAVVGASVGGNLACVASALYEVKTAVAISHKTSAIYNLAGRDELEFRSIYHLSSTGDQGGQRARWATELFEETSEPRKLEITRGSGHGVSIFNSDRTIPDRILEWLRETL